MIIHDLKDEKRKRCIREYFNQQVIIEAGITNYCKGCFGCWLKTPGECVIKDQFSNIPYNISQSKHYYFMEIFRNRKKRLSRELCMEMEVILMY